MLSLHKGVSSEDVISNTGFEVEIPGYCPTTNPPTIQEVNLVNKHRDPNGTRSIDFLSSKKRAKERPSELMREWKSA